jgi:LysM domain.
MEIWDGENDSHTVRSGESMHDIAQLYGLKVKSLYELNGLNIGDRIEVGQKLKLR